MDECYPNDIEAVEYTELVRVDKIAFHNVISHYPEELKKMKARAKGMGKEQKRITKNLQNAKMVAMFGDEDAEEEEVEDPFVFHPDSTFRITWDYISFALIMYNFVAVPLLIGFTANEGVVLDVSLEQSESRITLYCKHNIAEREI